MPPEYLRHLRTFLERRCIGGSVARNQGAAGMNERLRSVVGAIDLSKLSGIAVEGDFRKWLDAETTELVGKLGDSHGLKWGTARKVLNIWLRDLVYNGDLCEAHGLGGVRPFLEIPLDRLSSVFLGARAPGLPRWQGVKNLTPAVSDKYQDAATKRHQTAGSWAPCRVDLDLHAWAPED
jgi:hypothetical protein